jgi:hypothetical protein
LLESKRIGVRLKQGVKLGACYEGENLRLPEAVLEGLVRDENYCLL